MSRPSKPLADQLKPLARELRVRAKPVAIPAAATVDDASLLRRALAGVEPLQHPVHYRHPTQAVPPWPLQHPREEGQLVHDAMSDFWPWNEIESGEELLYLRAGQKLDTLKKLRRAHWLVQAQLDLHGLDSDAARAAVGGFLHGSVQRDKRCVRIIHGKGLSSKNRQPVLKNKLRNWLIQRDEVLAFCQARPVDGGAGAVLVLLRGTKRR